MFYIVFVYIMYLFFFNQLTNIITTKTMAHYLLIFRFINAMGDFQQTTPRKNTVSHQL